MLDGLVAPDADEQEHRGQLNLPEQEEEQQIERHKHAHHTGFQQQQQGHVVLDVWPLPTTDDGQHHQQRVQDYQRQAQAVNTQEVVDLDADTTRVKINPRQVDGITQV